MVIDTSAILAILLDEPEAEAVLDAIDRDSRRYLSAVNLLEASMVIESRKGPSGGRELDLLIYQSKIDIVNFTEELAEASRTAWRRWGKGNHPAGLNYCDCCAYALAQQLGEPLLFKGNDFSKTDVVSAT